MPLIKRSGILGTVVGAPFRFARRHPFLATGALAAGILGLGVSGALHAADRISELEPKLDQLHKNISRMYGMRIDADARAARMNARAAEMQNNYQELRSSVSGEVPEHIMALRRRIADIQSGAKHVADTSKWLTEQNLEAMSLADTYHNDIGILDAPGVRSLRKMIPPGSVASNILELPFNWLKKLK